jgi:hypothetical protein
MDYDIADQSRQGRSGSNNKINYQSGELDIVIRQNHRNGTVKSIIESFELKSCGPKSTIVKSHINKLLNCYDTAGNQENYIIVYARAKNFSELWQKYLDHVEDLIFKGNSKIEQLSNDKFTKAYVKVAKNELMRGDRLCSLYHIFANFYIKSTP